MTAPTEPLKLTPQAMTLEEALQRLHEDDFWLEPSKAGHGWVVYRWNDITDQIELQGSGATWPEAVSAALGAPVVARDEAAELRAALERFKAWADRWEGAVYARGIEAVMGTGPARKELSIAMNRASAALAASEGSES